MVLIMSLRMFFNLNMRNSHDGLIAIAAKENVKTDELDRGEYIVFINRKQDKLKLYATADVIAYLRMKPGNKINMGIIKYLPTVFNGRKIDYDKALELAVNESLNKKTREMFFL